VANTKSAIKRVQIAERNRLRNKAYKSAVKTLMKKYFAAVETYAANPTSGSKARSAAADGCGIQQNRQSCENKSATSK
jgi:small subunit ribosomal protein S20